MSATQNKNLQGHKSTPPIRVVIEVEIDKELCANNAAPGWTHVTAALKVSLSQCYLPLTTDITLRSVPSIVQRISEDNEKFMPHVVRETARTGAFEVVVSIVFQKESTCHRCMRS